MPKILVAVDGFPASEKALEVAVKLAQQDGGQLAAVAVLERPDHPHLEALGEGILAQVRQQQMQDVLQAAANFAQSRGVRLMPLLREGHPAESIITCAEEQGVELLVVGSDNGSSVRPGLGGTADQVSSHAPCTVMIVR
jgi:nucleotide-binding universal stress UspA family protein